MRIQLPQCLVAAMLLTPLACQAALDPDRDGDGLSDFQEVHKYLTDPDKADTDGDGIPDGDWRERREHQYTVRTVVQAMRPVTIEYLCDDHQDARVLDETKTYVELEVIHYPFTTVATTIQADKNWRKNTVPHQKWLTPGPTSDFTEGMQNKLRAKLMKSGIRVEQLDDMALVKAASKWLCAHAKNQDCFTTFVTAFDISGDPYIPEQLRKHVGHTDESLKKQWPRDISALGMFQQGVRGSCTSSAIYLNGSMRALGIPTRTILTIPLVDANDAQELRLVERGITHHGLRRKILPALQRLKGSWASHTFNEVWVGGRWRRLNYSRLGQDIVDANLFGMITHIATFHDWADARMPETIGKRQTMRHYDDVFGGPNPYSTISLRDEFGVHCKMENKEPEPLNVNVTAVYWGDGKDAPKFVREWFQKRGMYGLIARVTGPSDLNEMSQFLANVDLRVFLKANDAPTLGMGFEPGAQWWQGDHGWILVPFGAADKARHVTTKQYQFVCRNQGKASKWQIGDDVLVAARSN